MNARRRQHGDAWRWDTANHRNPSQTTISVIEPGEPRPTPAGGRLVPFGFARVLADGSDSIESKPDGWDQHAAMVGG